MLFCTTCGSIIVIIPFLNKAIISYFIKFLRHNTPIITNSRRPIHEKVHRSLRKRKITTKIQLKMRKIESIPLLWNLWRRIYQLLKLHRWLKLKSTTTKKKMFAKKRNAVYIDRLRVFHNEWNILVLGEFAVGLKIY